MPIQRPPGTALPQPRHSERWGLMVIIAHPHLSDDPMLRLAFAALVVGSHSGCRNILTAPISQCCQSCATMTAMRSTFCWWFFMNPA